jgi:peptidoglycan/xylan/chitin deacetylase (PgdA/CDA1 family)
MLIQNKKLYIIILTIIFVIIITYFFYIKKIEAPIKIETPTTKSNIETLDKEKEINNITPTSIEKYKISGRSVIVPENKNNKTKMVLITIDDGPSVRTKDMMEILKKHNAKAIFFINGMYNEKNQGVIADIYKEGFDVGNHTWSHMNLKKQPDSKIIEKEINKNTELIKKTTSNPPRFFRAPYGESNTIIRKYVKDNGMLFMDWSGAAMDWEKSTVDKNIFIGNVMSNIHSGSIILIHEHPWSVANFDELLNTIESKGYTYVDPKNIIE